MRLLNSRSQTNSFAYRNNQMYYPFYNLDIGNSFYNLSVAQYFSTTYNTLAYQGSSPGSNSRIGRYQRTVFTPIPIPIPTPTPIPTPVSTTNCTFKLSPKGTPSVNIDGYIINNKGPIQIYPVPLPPPIFPLPPTYSINDWLLYTEFGNNTINAENSNDFENCNVIYFTSNNSTSKMYQNLVGKITANYKYKLSIYIKTDATILNDQKQLGIVILLNDQPIATKKGITNNWVNYQIPLISSTTLENPLFTIQCYNATGDVHSVFIVKPNIII